MSIVAAKALDKGVGNPKTVKIKVKVKLKRKASRLSPAKAKMMLKDNSAQGHKLTGKQKKLFQAVAHGFKPTKKRGGVAGLYQSATKGVQNVGYQIAKNVSAGQKNAKGYGAINPLKGTGKAFSSAFKRKRKGSKVDEKATQAAQMLGDTQSANPRVFYGALRSSKNKLLRGMRGYKR